MKEKTAAQLLQEKHFFSSEEETEFIISVMNEFAETREKMAFEAAREIYAGTIRNVTFVHKTFEDYRKQNPL